MNYFGSLGFHFNLASTREREARAEDRGQGRALSEPTALLPLNRRPQEDRAARCLWPSL